MQITLASIVLVERFLFSFRCLFFFWLQRKSQPCHTHCIHSSGWTGIDCIPVRVRVWRLRISRNGVLMAKTTPVRLASVVSRLMADIVDAFWIVKVILWDGLVEGMRKMSNCHKYRLCLINVINMTREILDNFVTPGFLLIILVFVTNKIDKNRIPNSVGDKY